MTDNQISQLVQTIKNSGKEIYLVGRKEPGIMIDIEKDEGGLMDKIIGIGLEKVVQELGTWLYLGMPSQNQITEIDNAGTKYHGKYSNRVSLKDRIGNTPLEALFNYSLRLKRT